jgi:hypothetical protein
MDLLDFDPRTLKVFLLDVFEDPASCIESVIQL